MKLYIKGRFIVIQWNATGILNGMVKLFFKRWYLTGDIEGMPKVY